MEETYQVVTIPVTDLQPEHMLANGEIVIECHQQGNTFVTYLERESADGVISNHEIRDPISAFKRIRVFEEE